MNRKAINPAGLPSWPESFSQIMITEGAPRRMVFVSGQVAVDTNNNVIGIDDLAAQAEYAFRNLATALEAGGVAPSDVVRLRIYVVGYHQDQATVIRDAMRTVFADPPLPTSTWLGVERLALDGLLIEVEAMAVA